MARRPDPRASFTLVQYTIPGIGVDGAAEECTSVFRRIRGEHCLSCGGTDNLWGTDDADRDHQRVCIDCMNFYRIDVRPHPVVSGSYWDEIVAQLPLAKAVR